MNISKIDILIDGFCDEVHLADHNTARYRPNIVLIRVESLVIVVDPGAVEKQSDIAQALEKQGVHVSDVTHVIHTHHHLDHNRNTGMFADISVIDAWAIWNGVDYSTKPVALHPSIRIQPTPGHSYDSLTVFVETQEGVVAICGDVFWWENDTQSDIYATDAQELVKSRALVLKQSDIVIPGHGPRFLVNRF
jgi:glyoxylase-like metal-dependent hydrolase (beta-lactamase superfamily II)